jgi:hypothetical protein
MMKIANDCTKSRWEIQRNNSHQMSLHEFKFHLSPKQFSFALESSEEKNIARVLVSKIIAKFTDNLLSAFNLKILVSPVFIKNRSVKILDYKHNYVWHNLCLWRDLSLLTCFQFVPARLENDVSPLAIR